MSLCTISGSAQSPSGALIEGDVIIIRPSVGAAFADGAVAVIPKTTRVVVGAGSTVSFTLYSGRYVAQTVTERGADTWSLWVPDAASASFAECLTAVAERVYTQTELDVLVGAGMQTYTDTAEGLANTTNGKFFMVPAAPMGLAIYENVAGVATVRGGLLTQSLLSDGSAAAPALAFTGDTNTGIYRQSADQIGFATGGVQRALLGSTSLSVSVPITGLAVTQSARDATTGRLLKNGDHGIGAVVDTFAGDVDTLTANGFYRLTTGASSTASTNVGLGAGQYLTHLQWDSSVAHQTLYTRSSGEPRTYERAKSSGIWSLWREVFSQINVIGTVSRTGSVPTGAVIERGSNANGEYVRYADGTQICTHAITDSVDITTASTTFSYRSVLQSWTYPASFSAVPRTVTSASVPTSVGARNATSLGYYLGSFGSQVAASRTVDLIAIGRWF